MNASRLSEIKQSVIAKFLGMTGNSIPKINLFAGSTEEVQHELKKGNDPVAIKFANGGLARGRGATQRLEENYLFDTRRFNSGAMVAGEFLFFANAIGLPGANNGFPAAITMTEVETNMDVASQVPQGKDFVMTQIGVSFNSNISTPDCATLMESGALRFSKQGGQFNLKHGPVRFWPGGTGLSGYTFTNVAATTVQAAHNGDASIGATRRLTVPRVIRAKETFSYSYFVPRTTDNKTAATAISLVGNCLMSVWLWGAQRDNIPS